MSQLLDEYPVVIELPVQWGDQDAFGHVNNVVYFRWFESARIAYFDRPGLCEISISSSASSGLILASIKCDYRRPLNFPDQVSVGARVRSIGRSSITMEHRLASHRWQEVAAEGESVIVMYDYAEERSTPVTPALRQAIEQLEGKKFPAPA